MPLKRGLTECESHPAPSAAAKRLSSCFDQLQLTVSGGYGDSDLGVIEPWQHETPPPSPQSSPASPQSVFSPVVTYTAHAMHTSPPPPPSPAHRHSRLNVLHSTVAKLGQHRTQCDPRLHQSVLLYNTVRLIERQLSAEGVTLATALHPHHLATTAAAHEPTAPLPTPPQQLQLVVAPLAIDANGFHGNREGPLVAMDTDDDERCELTVSCIDGNNQMTISPCSSTSSSTGISWSSLLTLGDPLLVSGSSSSSSSSLVDTSQHSTLGSFSSSPTTVSQNEVACCGPSVSSTWSLSPMTESTLWRVSDATPTDAPDQASCLMQL